MLNRKKINTLANISVNEEHLLRDCNKGVRILSVVRSQPRFPLFRTKLDFIWSRSVSFHSIISFLILVTYNVEHEL